MAHLLFENQIDTNAYLKLHYSTQSPTVSNYEQCYPTVQIPDIGTTLLQTSKAKSAEQSFVPDSIVGPSMPESSNVTDTTTNIAPLTSWNFQRQNVSTSFPLITLIENMNESIMLHSMDMYLLNQLDWNITNFSSNIQVLQSGISVSDGSVLIAL